MFRVGIGYDVHRLEEGCKLIIGGVEIPFEKGLKGHSDADVLVHAICDAILGALALGDIGEHFPDTDEKFKGISSLILLKEVNEKAKSLGFQVANVDSVVVAQRPKLSPYKEKMRENIADVLNIPVDNVSVKATTTEKLGFEGRGEGISAKAVVLLRKVEG
ncbi:MAG: 2-C-methyl-D-erythritol 2,4-cyclodiphosphate synthase [Desulfurobacteriaceae bacterium]